MKLDLSRINYDPETGEFRWIRPASNRVKTGDVAGSLSRSGYLFIRVDGRRYAAHRLAWFVVHGEWPKQCIDHINGQRSDNRIVNLRDISHKANSRHQLWPSKNNTVGYLGVSRSGKRFKTEITVNRKRLHIGSFLTAEEASSAYQKAKAMYHHPGAA